MTQNISPAEQTEKSGISGREILYGIVGVVLGLLMLSGVWLATGANADSELPSVTQVDPYAAPAFTLKDLDGTPVSLEQLKGKVVLLNFWGTWCEPCKEETPALEAAYQNMKDQGFVVVGIDLFNAERNQNRTLDHVRAFAQTFNVSYPIVLDDSGAVSQAYAIAPIPTSYFIDPQGKVRYIRVGQLQRDDVERVVRKLQAED